MRDIVSPIDGIRSPFGPVRLRPSIDLNFLSGTLDSRITFSRPSLATIYDSTGKLTYAPNNLMLQSNALGTSPWVMAQAGVALSPVATNAYSTYAGRNQTRLQFSLNGGTTTGAISFAYQAITYIGTTIHSVFLVSTDGVSTYNMQITGADGTAQNIVVTGTPSQFFVKQTATGTVNYAIRLRGGQSPANSNTADILAWDSQLEAVTYETTPRTYNATTSAAYYGPRFDYNPATLAARGLLIEEARTNICLRSQDATVSPWSFDVSTGSGVALTGGLAPDGVTQFAVFNEGTSTGGHRVNQGISTVAATAYTISAYIKAGTSRYILLGTTRGGIAIDTQDWAITQTIAAANTTTSNGSLTEVGGGVYRASVSVSHTTDTSSFFIISTSVSATPGTMAPSFAGTSRTAIFTFCQFEVGSFATSYIPTAASSVARSADSASMTGTNFSSWYNQAKGTLLVQFAGPASGTRGIMSIDDNTANDQIRLITSGTDPKFDVTDGGSPQVDIDAGTVASGTSYKFAGAYSLNDFAACIGGGVVGTDASGTLPTVDRMRIGSTQASNALNGHIASITYYNTRLPNTKLQSLTT